MLKANKTATKASTIKESLNWTIMNKFVLKTGMFSKIAKKHVKLLWIPHVFFTTGMKKKSNCYLELPIEKFCKIIEFLSLL